VNVHWHCIVSNMEGISKLSSFFHWKSFCRCPCFWLEFFQVSGIFPICFACFLPANIWTKYRDFNKPFLCNIRSLETWNLPDRDETWNLRDRDSQKWVSRPRRILETPSLMLLWLKITPTYWNTKNNNVRRKSTSPSLQDELKKITVWSVY